jgi:hypothetical protein
MTNSPVQIRLFMAVFVCTFASGCVQEFELTNDLMSFEVSFSAMGPAQGTGSEQTRLSYVAGEQCTSDESCPAGQVCISAEETNRCAKQYVFNLLAIGRDGQPFPYRGPVHIRVTPGIIVDGDTVRMMDDGTLENQLVHIAQSTGKCHIWFEADGFLPRPDGLDYGQCADGVDNDANGLLDMADPGCQSVEDDMEAPFTLATGVSETLWFANPTIQDLQHAVPPSLYSSPLVGSQAQVTSGNLVVSNVVSNGFYLIDLNDNTPTELFNSLFIFTYSKPKEIYYGDRLCGFSGAVQEHVGHTQIVFPSFERYTKDNLACQDFKGLDIYAQVPAPWPLTNQLLVESPTDSDYFPNVYANSTLLEAYESNLVIFSNVAVSTRFISCDKNGNGLIDSGTDEHDCRDECQDDSDGVICTDLEGYFQYAQYAGVTDGKKKIYGSVALASNYKPLDIAFIGDEDQSGRCEVQTTDLGFIEYTCTPHTLSTLAGSLRHIYLCGDSWEEEKCDLQFWVVDPRFDLDVVLAGTTE